MYATDVRQKHRFMARLGCGYNNEILHPQQRLTTSSIVVMVVGGVGGVVFLEMNDFCVSVKRKLCFGCGMRVRLRACM